MSALSVGLLEEEEWGLDDIAIGAEPELAGSEWGAM